MTLFAPRFQMRLLMLALLLCPIRGIANETPMLNVEFILLHELSETALLTEAWNNTAPERQAVQAKIDRLNNNNTQSYQNNIARNSNNQLLKKLKPLLRKGRHNILYSTSWQQPASQKRYTHTIEHSIDQFDPYNLAFGRLKLQDRAALVAMLDIHIIDTLSLQEQQLDTPIEQTSIDSGYIIGDDFINDPVVNSEQDKTPLLFLKQQRKIKLDKIHYFDHPVTPGFLLVSTE